MNEEKNKEMIHCFFKINHKNKSELFGLDQIKIKQMELSFLLADDKDNNIRKSLDLYFNKIIPKNKGIISSSMNFSSLYEKNNSQFKNKCDHSIDSLLKIKSELQYYDNLELTLDKIREIGIILLYGYKKLNQFNIFDENTLNEYTSITRSKEINVMNDCYQFCINKSYDPSKISKEKFFDKHSKTNNYIIPPEFIFLENIFCKIKKLTINFNWSIDKMKNDDLYLYMSILLNKKYIFSKLEGINVELDNEDLNKSLYEYYQNKMIEKGKEYNKQIIPINFNLEKKKESKRDWNMKDNFISIKEKEENNFESKIKNLDFEFEIISEDKIPSIKKKNIIYSFKLIFDSIIYLFGILPFISNLNNLSLSFPINLSREIYYYFEFYHKYINFPRKIHFIDFFFVIQNVKNFFFNFNSLDNNSFLKILSLIDSNQNLKSLNISFFTEEISFSSPSLYKLYCNLEEYNFFKKEHNFDKEINKFIINELLQTFEENLTNFFVLFQVKKSLEEISIFFDIPRILLSNDYYLMTITKFILNFLLLFDGDNNNIKLLKILSPYTRFDNRTFPSIEEIFNEINYEKNNNTLQHIYLQFQFYHIKNISNILTTNLLSISIGDLDEISFIYFIKYITKINFTQQSKLNSISIELLSMISNPQKIESSIQKLFNIYIHSLKEINFHSNLYIDKKKHNEFVNILNLNFTETINIDIHQEQKIKRLLYFPLKEKDKYMILKRIFKGKIRIIKECLTYLYPSERVKFNQK